MSIKIYNGKKIIHNKIDFSEMFNYIKNTKKDLEKTMRKDFLEEYSKVAIRFKVEQDITNRNSIWFNIRFEEYEKINKELSLEYVKNFDFDFLKGFKLII